MLNNRKILQRQINFKLQKLNSTSSRLVALENFIRDLLCKLFHEALEEKKIEEKKIVDKMLKFTKELFSKLNYNKSILVATDKINSYIVIKINKPKNKIL